MWSITFIIDNILLIKLFQENNLINILTQKKKINLKSQTTEEKISMMRLRTLVVDLGHFSTHWELSFSAASRVPKW